MKKSKQHYYAGRIKKFALAITVMLAVLFTYAGTHAKYIKAQDVITTSMSTAMAAPFTIVKDMKKAKKWDDLEADTQDYLSEMEKSVNAAFDRFKTDLISDDPDAEDSLTSKFDKLLTENKGLLSAEQQQEFKDAMIAIKEHATQLAQLKDKGLSMTFSESIIKTLKDNDAKIKSFIKDKSGSLTMEIKSGTAQAPTDIATHTIGVRVPGIGQIPVRKPFMIDLFTTINVELEFIKYIDQETVVRDAQFVNTAAISNHTTKLTWKERNIQVTNIRDLIDVPINMLDDYDFVQGEVERLLNTNVALKKDNGLLTGTGANPDLHSVGEKASEFDAANTLGGTITPFAGTVQAPNIFDLVIAMSAQVIALGQDGSFMPNVVLFNTIDRYKSMLIKDENNNYILPPFVARVNGNEYTIDGMVVRSNPAVPANSCWVFDSTKGTIYQRKGAVLEISYENNKNFETEVATMKVYERLNFLIRNVDANAFMKCTDVATALIAIGA